MRGRSSFDSSALRDELRLLTLLMMQESKRPLIFIAHSLGGIIVKQALVWAHREPRYQSIKDHTLGIVFFGTPHRGSGKANYGKTLANVAAGVMHKPKSKLIDALQSNSDTLMTLTREFKFDAPNIQIMTFYETKPMSIFSSLVSVRHSGPLVHVTHCFFRLSINIRLFLNSVTKTHNQ